MTEMTPQEVRAHLEEAPAPMEGEPIWDRFGDKDQGYDMAARALARAMLVLAEERPELLDVSEENERDPSGWEAASNDKLWQAVKERWPGLDDWVGGATGFQFGWAHSAVRHVLGAGPVGNPALVTLQVKETEEAGE